MPKHFSFLGSILALTAVLHAADPRADDLASQLRDFNSTVVPADSERARQLPTMVADDVRARLRAASQRETKHWQDIKTRADWERYRDPRIQALRDSLGATPALPKDLKVQATKTHQGDGYRVENIIFESRPGLVVTANLYSPKEPGKAMPGIVICPSHHNPKTQSELQDMGVGWARLGCLVLVLDNLGHGERRQHPFKDAASYDGKFAVGRQDYWFRYNVAMQLHLAGESLIGWMAWDLMRCVDVLLARPGIAKERIALFGSVAGGGDPAAVAGALDPRISCIAPFNFGGPQPETVFPLPPDAESAFNYTGSGSWESTRNLRLSARDGFLPWVIVGSIAPRRLMYAHEFSWDKERDPVWARLQKIYSFYDAADAISSANGKGKVTGKAPDSTHCNNIGPIHRQGMYPALNRWLALDLSKESEDRRKSDELQCLTPEAEKAFKAKSVHELATALAVERGTAARERRAALKPEARRKHLADDWAKLLGDMAPGEPKQLVKETQKLGDVTAERILLEVEPRIVVPVVLLLPARKGDAKLPLAIGLAQEGKREFLKQRSAEVAELLKNGVAVCLPDVRGTGETKPNGDSRGRGSASTSLSSSELMLGRTMLGQRVKDVRSLMRYLRGREELDTNRLALWGESFAPFNAADRNVKTPWDAEKLPASSEPLGGLLALFGALYEPDVKAVSVHGGLVSYQSVLQGQFCFVPHDVIVPGALTTGDLCDVAAVLAPRALRLEGMVDGVNRRVSADGLKEAYALTRAAYLEAKAEKRFSAAEKSEGRASTWLGSQLMGK